jgi:hypothetical protein
MNSSLRQIPCACGYDLRGRHVGDTCPECGWVIDAPGPRWCTADTLHRLARMSRLAWIPCVMLLAVPALFVLGLATYETGSNDRIWMTTFGAFCVLMPLQIITQAVAAWRIAACGLGRRRVVRLRIAALVRVAAFVLAVLAIATEAQGVRWTQDLALLAYSTLPLAAIGSDFITLRTLGGLRRESNALVSGRHAVLPPFATWGLLAVYPMILVPFIGWFFAPILWTSAMAIGFAQVGAVAEYCRKQLP